MKRIQVTIFCHTNSEHVAQLYAGFGELEAQGKIDVRWVISQSNPSPYQQPILEIELNGRWRIAYDQADTYELIPERVDLQAVDLLFKRSYRPDYLRQQPFGDKVMPTGLNYFVVSRYDRGFRRALAAQNKPDKLKLLLKQVHFLARMKRMSNSVFDCRIENFEAPPLYDPEPSILFAARLWKPHRVQRDELKSERDTINARRIDIVRCLRQEFGSRFIGGIIPDEYSRQIAADALLTDPHLSYRKSYLDLVRHASVCIATRGLLESTGWKFAEYIAASRAIVSEANANPIYGGLEEGRHYLGFNTVEECIEQVRRLIRDSALRYEMMKQNMLYYRAYLRPDALVMNTLVDALARLNGASEPARI